MPGKDSDRFVDELLDAALARYRSAEPRTGLEERVLANLQSQPRPRPQLLWGWMPLLATAGVLVVAGAAFYLARSRSLETAPSRPIVARTAEPPTVAVPAVTPTQPAPARSPGRAAAWHGQPMPAQRAVVAPRRERFPSPARLSGQEVLLLRYVALVPKEALIASRAMGQPIEDLRIEPLHIPELVAVEPPREK